MIYRIKGKSSKEITELRFYYLFNRFVFIVEPKVESFQTKTEFDQRLRFSWNQNRPQITKEVDE